MKLLRNLLAVATAVFLLSGAARAADLSGRWTWIMQNRSGPQEVHATFTVKDGVLTGTVSGRLGDAPIGDATVKDDQVHFTVTREVSDGKIVIKYDGKIAGDAITGTIERPGRDGDAALILEWKATRVP